MAIVERERRGQVEILRFNRPEARNAISPEVSVAMAGFLDVAATDPVVRAVVVTGTGPVFSAGADLKVVAKGGGASIANAPGGFAGLVTRDFPKPLIAAVNGPALAGGFEIVLACDLVVAADTARFGIPEVQRGLMAAAGALIRLPKRVPLAIAFLLRSVRGERLAGLAVVLAIFVSACVAFYETIQRFIHPQHLSHLWVLAAAGAIGFVGNELAAQVRLRAGERLASPALVADGKHARIDGFVSLGVVASAALVASGARIGDPIVGLAITLVILKITWDSWWIVRAS